VHTPPVTSLREIFERLRAKAAQTPPGRWVIGRGSYSLAGNVSEKRMATREDLDAISQDHPIALMSGLHVIMLNTRAFKELKLWDPAAASDLRWRDGRRRVGTDIARAADGTPTGVATEIYDLFPEDLYTPEEKRAAIKGQVKEHFLAKGITSLATMPFFRNDYPIDQQLQAAGELPIRMRAYYIVPMMISLDGLVDMGLLPGAGDDMFRFGGVKLFVGGAGADSSGKRLDDLKWTQEELEETVGRAHSAGLQVIMHQAGRESLRLTLAAVEKAQRRDPRPLRHRLEHYGGLEDLQEIRRVKNLGMPVTITLPQERSRRGTGQRAGAGPTTPRYRTMIQEGINLIGISDATGTIPTFTPLFGIASISALPEDGGSSPANEAPTWEQALRMCTLWAAQGQFEEQDKGSIAVGKFGDFAVLARDPRGVPAAELFDLKVEATIVGGSVVFER
jgi:predicted amidohydrolase YtcJ